MDREPSVPVSSISIRTETTSKIKPYQTMRGHTEGVTGIVNLPDGRHIITCSYDGSLRLWDWASGAQIGSDWRDDGDEDETVWTMALSQDGRTVAAGRSDGTVRLWDVEMRKMATWTGHTDGVRSVCWSADGKHMVSGSDDGTIRVWDVESGETVLGPIKTGNLYVWAVVYSPDTSKIATGGFHKAGIEIWDAGTGELLSTLGQDQIILVWSLAYTSDQKKIIAGLQNGLITIFDTATQLQIANLDGHSNPVNAISLFKNDRLLASASGDNTARLWNLGTNLQVGPCFQHEDNVYHTALSADGTFLVTACNDNSTYVWDTYSILKDAGCEDLLTDLSAADLKSILDTDTTRHLTKPEDIRTKVLRGFFDDA